MDETTQNLEISGIVISLILLFIAWRFFKKKRLMENTPTSKIRSLAMGFVEIKGKAKPFENMNFIGPISQRPCVYYQFLAEEYRRYGKSGSWHKLVEGDCGCWFYLEDETGKVLINPLKSKMEVRGVKGYQKSFSKDPEHIVNFYNDISISVKRKFFGKKDLRVTEKRIELNDELYILGNASKSEQNLKGTNNTAGIVLKKSWKVPLYITDKSEKNLVNKYSAWILLSLIGGIAVLTMSISYILKSRGII